MSKVAASKLLKKVADCLESLDAVIHHILPIQRNLTPALSSYLFCIEETNIKAVVWAYAGIVLSNIPVVSRILP